MQNFIECSVLINVSFIPFLQSKQNGVDDEESEEEDEDDDDDDDDDEDDDDDDDEYTETETARTETARSTARTDKPAGQSEKTVIRPPSSLIKKVSK